MLHWLTFVNPFSKSPEADWQNQDKCIYYNYTAAASILPRTQTFVEIDAAIVIHFTTTSFGDFLKLL